MNIKVGDVPGLFVVGGEGIAVLTLPRFVPLDKISEHFRSIGIDCENIIISEEQTQRTSSSSSFVRAASCSSTSSSSTKSVKSSKKHERYDQFKNVPKNNKNQRNGR